MKIPAAIAEVLEVFALMLGVVLFVVWFVEPTPRDYKLPPPTPPSDGAFVDSQGFAYPVPVVRHDRPHERFTSGGYVITPVDVTYSDGHVAHDFSCAPVQSETR